MNTFWKLFAALVTGLKSEPFKRARLRLTIYYIAIMAVILAAFSLFLYFSLTKNITDNLENDTNLSDNQVVSNTIDQIQTTILSVDAVVLFLVAGLSYVLAGKTLKPIQAALEAQTQFTADASHEFRTPLAIIKYNGDIALKNSKLTIDEAREVIGSSVEEAEHMSAIVERLLMLARNENGWNNLGMEQLDLKDLLEKAVRSMSVLAENKNLVLKIKRTEPVKVSGNPGSLNEMILNILQNSIDYTPAGGRITVELFQKDRYARMVVSDTGIGISADDMPHIFERFYKSDKARTLKQGGGLGLSIVQNILQKHKGTIEITSEPDKGTKVSVSLPSVVDNF